MSRFYIDDSSSPTSPTRASSDSDSDTDLPYPAPLERSVFLQPDFTPQTYLSTLHNRHQTLEDLRSELRSRSALLSRELLDLVNTHYTDFLTLGASLKGGDERVEEVRVGLLGFRKEREEEVERLVREREETRRKIAVGRQLVGYEEGLRGLEEGLVIEAATGASDTSDEEEDDDYDGDEDEDKGVVGGVSIAKLRRHVLQWRVVREAEKKLGEHPFVAAQAPRMSKVRNTLLLDLSTALQQAKAVKVSGRVMGIMKVYAEMGEEGEAVKVLKGLKA
ncbi:uncharacterized protein N0V89_010808 [Didymosphaeria variabile]|uniref:Conserved oligomeric Golgi complex subunit 2 n=1 Tax=Didymosphaeria variabile TaxID=1932322 RepID=A0A9W8XC14_9PLEO|nr:uncharacterized protein N0V89_010808 [Didymosphaeria variabile]KAJ4346875.1 hypothetical protein N0V89_010808 [Didymosphaeria variabile]